MKKGYDFGKFKGSLKAYLATHGVDVSQNPTYCINPQHNNTDTPAMLLYDDNFRCASCGVKGDIYDACGLIMGISNKGDQFKEIERQLGVVSSREDFVKPKKTKQFKPEPDAIGKVVSYLRGSADREKNVELYLKQRCSTPEMVNKLKPYFGWWPGYAEAEKALGWTTLRAAGIPGKNPKTGNYSWGPAGTVLRIGSGFKLFFYKDGKSQKIASKRGRTFPTPKLPDGDTIYLTEGEISALSMRFAGWREAVAVGGVNALTAESVEALKKYKNIVIVFDGDAAGIKGPQGLIEKLQKAGYSRDIRVAALPEGTDPDDLVKTGRTGELKEAIEKAWVQKTAIKAPRTNINAEQNKIDPPFSFLGYNEKAYFFMPKSQNLIIRIGRGNASIKNLIEEIAPPKWWADNFKTPGRDGAVIFDFTAASNWLRDKSYEAGIFSPDKVVGVGPHRDSQGIIVNTGKCLLRWGGGEIQYNDYKGDLIFSRSQFEFAIPDKGWDRKGRDLFIAGMRTFNFESSLHRACVSGYLAIAPFASLLYRCPHIWITGQRGSGKTFLIDRIIEPALGKFVIKAEGGTSEAGIRQSIGRDCRPVIMDEFEANRREERHVIEAILGLARSAYGGSAKIKGTTDHEAISFKTKMMFCFSSVKTYLSNAANSSRIAIVRLRKIDPGSAKLGQLPPMEGLKRLIFDRLDEVIENCALAKEAIVNAGNDERTGDTYAPLLTGAWMIASDKPFLQGENSQNEGMKLIIDEINQEQQQQEDDEARVLAHILQHNVRLAHDEVKSIAEMLTAENDDPMTFDSFLTPYDEHLRRLGIRKMERKIRGGYRKILAISCKHSEIERILDDTAFVEYRDVLARHRAFIPEEGSGKNKFPVIWMAGKSERVMMFDWAQISAESLYPPEGEDEIPF